MDLKELPDTAAELFLLDLSLEDLKSFLQTNAHLHIYSHASFLEKLCVKHRLPILDNMQKIVSCLGKTQKQLQSLALSLGQGDYLLQGENMPSDSTLARALAKFGTSLIVQVYAKFLTEEEFLQCSACLEDEATFEKLRASKLFERVGLPGNDSDYQASCYVLGGKTPYPTYKKLARMFAVGSENLSFCESLLKNSGVSKYHELCNYIFKLDRIDFGLKLLHSVPEIMVAFLESAVRHQRLDLVERIKTCFNQICTQRMQALVV